MAEYLMRENAPLKEDEWSHLDDLVAETARRILVGRRVVPLFGPLGAAVQTVPVGTFGGVGPGTSGKPVRQVDRKYLVLQEITKDFILNWQDIEAARSGIMPMHLGPAAAAAATCAVAEDTLIFRGDKGIEGLMTVKGRLESPMGDWAAKGAFGDITAALQKLQENSFPDHYALVVSPAGYAQMQRPYGNTGALEIALVRELVTDGVYQTPVLKPSEAVLIATGPQNMDLAVGIDLSVAYLDTEDMDHRFRVVETLALRVKQPTALCTITK